MKDKRLHETVDKIRDSVAFKVLVCIFGGLVYSIGCNIFVRPLGLFNGGVVGYSQLLTHFVEESLGRTTNLYAICYVVLNIPLFILAFCGISKRFFFRTILGVGSITIFGYLIPTLTEPIIDNVLTCSIIGGMFTGIGSGIILLAGGCGGGMDIVGVWLSKKKPDGSVGKISILCNLVLYVILFFVFDFETVLYTVIVAVASSISLDRVHYQNITSELMIFTKRAGLDKFLIGEHRRGITEWNGAGAFTDQETHILVTCVSKYEEHEFIEQIKQYDPQAFVIINEHVRIRGNFEKRM